MKNISQNEKIKHDPSYQYTYTMNLGPWTSYSMLHDPAHLVFVLARYKFVSRLLNGKNRVLEVGCGDAFGTPVVASHCGRLVAVDIDKRIIQSDIDRLSLINNLEFLCCDFCLNPPQGKFDAVYSIDVIEHIQKNSTGRFMENIRACLDTQGVCIIGTPNSTAKKYASPQSKKYHVNLQNYESLNTIMLRYFINVFMFSMNDEVVHTGFAPMAHYLFGVGVGVRNF